MFRFIQKRIQEWRDKQLFNAVKKYNSIIKETNSSINNTNNKSALDIKEIEFTDNSQTTPKAQKQLVKIKSLIKKGADPYTEYQKGNSALSLGAARGDKNVVAALVQNSTKNAEIALLHAAKGANIEVVEDLLQKGTNPNAARNQDGNTALIYAASSGNTATVKSLIKYKADRNATNKFGDTSLMIATENGNTDNIKLLLTKANVNAMNQDGDTALTLAIKYGTTDAINLLLKEGADCIDVDKRVSDAILMKVVAQDKTESIEPLIKAGAYFPRAEGEFGALHLAVIRKNTEAVGILLKNGANIYIKDNTNTAPLDLVEISGYTDNQKEELNAVIKSYTTSKVNTRSPQTTNTPQNKKSNNIKRTGNSSPITTTIPLTPPDSPRSTRSSNSSQKGGRGHSI
jgi:ankyrin repeat protein